MYSLMNVKLCNMI